MRTLLPSEPIRGDHRRVAGTPSRGLALGILLVGVLAGGCLSAASGDPGQPARWVYRTVIRARGGVFISFPGVVLQSGVADCGPAALATLIKALGGVPPRPDSIGSLAGTGARGTTFEGLARAARMLGVASELRRMGPAAMAHLPSPVIAWVDRGHFVTVVPDSGRYVVILDPGVGPYRIPVARLRRFWSGEALVPGPVRTSADMVPPVSLEGG
jgi:hypothetical protein